VARAEDILRPIETGTIDVDGIETFYRRIPGEGEPVVFMHGNPTHSEDWMPILERMRGPAVAFDLPGFGRSQRPEPERFDYSVGTYTDFVERALLEFGVGEYSLVVHDWGPVALIAALRDPGRLRRLVVINAVPLLTGYRWHRLARIWRTPRLGELSNRLWNRPMLDQALRESRGDWSRHAPEFVDLIWDHLDAGTFRAILRWYRSAPESELERLGAGLGSVRGPSLVVWGLKDRYLPARFGRAYAEALPNSQLIELPDSGHWPWRDEPSVIPRLVEFLEGDREPAATSA
jgi:pimeloyl-ACP methyl ester carboxylesterase